MAERVTYLDFGTSRVHLATPGQDRPCVAMCGPRGTPDNPPGSFDDRPGHQGGAVKRHTRQVREIARIVRDGFEHVMSETDALEAAEKGAALPSVISAAEARAISELIAGSPSPKQEKLALKALGRLDGLKASSSSTSPSSSSPDHKEER